MLHTPMIMAHQKTLPRIPTTWNAIEYLTVIHGQISHAPYVFIEQRVKSSRFRPVHR